MIIKKFNPKIYSSLVEIDEVKTNPGYNKDILPILGRVIKKYGWENKVIVSLVHRHFDLSSDEKMVADYDLKKKEWISKPSDIDECKMIPWNWKVDFDSETGNLSWFPLDFLYDIPKFKEEKEVVRNLIADTEFLEELSSIIIKEGVKDVFGMALLMTEFNDAGIDLVMFEKNDIVHRISNSFFIPTKGLNNPDAVTQWHFRNNEFYKAEVGILRWCDHM